MSKKLIVILAVVGVLILGMMGAGFFVIWTKVANMNPGATSAEASIQEEQEETPEDTIGVTYPLDTFIVNLADSQGKKYLKIKVEFELDNPVVPGEIDQRLPQFRDTILTVLSSKTFEDIRQLEGKYQLRAEIMTMLNQFLKSGKITNVYFTEFIVQ